MRVISVGGLAVDSVGSMLPRTGNLVSERADTIKLVSGGIPRLRMGQMTDTGVNLALKLKDCLLLA